MPLTSADLRRLVAATGEPADDLVDWLAPAAVDMTGEPESFVLLRGGARALMTLAQRAGACRFLDGEARCTVYGARPDNCRLYPFAPEFGKRGGLRRLRLLGGTECVSQNDGTTDAHALREADARRWAEHRAYLAELADWNRSQRHRERLQHQMAGATEFWRFLGIAAPSVDGAVLR